MSQRTNSPKQPTLNFPDSFNKQEFPTLSSLAAKNKSPTPSPTPSATKQRWCLVNCIHKVAALHAELAMTVRNFKVRTERSHSSQSWPYQHLCHSFYEEKYSLSTHQWLDSPIVDWKVDIISVHIQFPHNQSIIGCITENSAHAASQPRGDLVRCPSIVASKIEDNIGQIQFRKIKNTREPNAYLN